MKKLLSIIVIGASVLFNGIPANAIETKQFEMGMVGVANVQVIEGSLRWYWSNMRASTSDSIPPFRTPYYYYSCDVDQVSGWWDSGLITCPSGTLRTTVIDVFVNPTSKIRISLSGTWQFSGRRTYVSGNWTAVSSGCTGIYAGFSGGGQWGGVSDIDPSNPEYQVTCYNRAYSEEVIFAASNDTLVYFTGTLTRADL